MVRFEDKQVEEYESKNLVKSEIVYLAKRQTAFSLLDVRKHIAFNAG